MKPGAICDGVCRDPLHAPDGVGKTDLGYAGLPRAGKNAVKGGYWRHSLAKDLGVVTPRATLTVKHMRDGQFAKQFTPLADVLRADECNCVTGFESTYHPGNGNFEAGFCPSIGTFKRHFV